ncbi:Protein IDA-LIKE 4 [Linum perenne]
MVKTHLQNHQPTSHFCMKMVFLIMVLLLLVRGSHGGRTSTNGFRVRDEGGRGGRGHFSNFLPRHLPIPTSGPSRRHNEIGLQAWRSP